jgi:hypothetical protein
MIGASMMLVFSSLACLMFVLPIHSVPGDGKEPELTDYQKVMRGLAKKDIRADLPSEKMLDLSIPTTQRTVGRFTEYEFVLFPGYHGLSIIAKSGLLKRATEWSCTYTRTHFNELTVEDERQYQKLCNNNSDVPPERFIGRLGWERPPKRYWKRRDAKPRDALEK